jgi:hypothetical protein
LVGARAASGNTTGTHWRDARACGFKVQCLSASFFGSLCDAMVALIFPGLKRINTRQRFQNISGRHDCQEKKTRNLKNLDNQLK